MEEKELTREMLVDAADDLNQALVCTPPIALDDPVGKLKANIIGFCMTGDGTILESDDELYQSTVDVLLALGIDVPADIGIVEEPVEKKVVEKKAGVRNCTFVSVAIGDIKMGANVRKSADRAGIEELADSIAANGLLQPVVLKQGKNGYTLIAGYRRYLAHEHLKSKDIQAIVYEDISDVETTQLIENICREDLSPADIEKALKTVMLRENLTQDALAKRVGKGREWVKDLLGAEKVRTSYKEERGAGHPPKKEQIDNIPSSTMRNIGAIKDKEKQKKVIEKAAEEKTPRKEIRKIVKEEKEQTEGKKIKERSQGFEDDLKEDILEYSDELSVEDRKDFVEDMLSFFEGLLVT